MRPASDFHVAVFYNNRFVDARAAHIIRMIEQVIAFGLLLILERVANVNSMIRQFETTLILTSAAIRTAFSLPNRLSTTQTTQIEDLSAYSLPLISRLCPLLTGLQRPEDLTVAARLGMCLFLSCAPNSKSISTPAVAGRFQDGLATEKQKQVILSIRCSSRLFIRSVKGQASARDLGIPQPQRH